LRQAKDSYNRAVITSPVDGIVNALNVTTIAVVVGPGHVVAEVSPEKDFLNYRSKNTSKGNIWVYYCRYESKNAFQCI
jgi:hypothetical protein